MPVPGFQSWFLPILNALSGGEVRRVSDLEEPLTRALGLTPEDKAELLPSGTQPKYLNRIGWARTYLKKAGLIESTSRGELRITSAGIELLGRRPTSLSIRDLQAYPQFQDFKQRSRRLEPSQTQAPESAEVETPEETFERVHKEIKAGLVAEILERIKVSSPSFFERLVVELLLRMGYGGSREDAGRTVGRSGDGGIDGIINEDRLGLDVIYLQAKRWDATVGRPVVQAFAGSLEGVKARKGILITTSTFSADARQYVSRIEDRPHRRRAAGLAHVRARPRRHDGRKLRDQESRLRLLRRLNPADST